MDIYGKQLGPLLSTVIEAGGTRELRPDGEFFERAVCRALLSQWEI
jgi:hypothetical protein